MLLYLYIVFVILHVDLVVACSFGVFVSCLIIVFDLVVLFDFVGSFVILVVILFCFVLIVLRHFELSV